jgi:hypothetical protein
MTDSVELPAEVLADHARQQALLDSEPRVLAPEGVEIDEWEHIDTADVEYVEWDDDHDDLHVWLEGETTLQRRVARATHWEPAAYANDSARVLISIVWDFDPESAPSVDIEVVPE